MANITSTSKAKIPFFGLDRQYQYLREEILEASDAVFKTGHVLDGEFTREFELAIAKKTHREYAVVVNSGTSALIMALWIIGQAKPGLKTLIPAQSFIATLNSTLLNRHDPVICDVDPVTGLMDLTKMPESGIDIIMYVNLFGNVIDYNDLMVRTKFFDNVPIIEDAAQSFGAWYGDRPSGSLGDISILSFDPTKNLPNYGSGGMLLTDNQDWATMAHNLRNNGKMSNYTIPGGNSKMSEADCAQLLVKLKYFDTWQERRQQIADYYMANIDKDMLIPISPNVKHAWSKFVVHHGIRAMLQRKLQDDGIESKIHYEKSLNYHSHHGYPTFVLDGEEQFSDSCLSLPIYPELTDGEVEHIAASVRNWGFQTAP